MTALSVLCALAIFVAVVLRLAEMAPASKSFGCHCAHFTWAVAHVLIALGAVSAVLSALAGQAVTHLSPMLINAGLCVLLLIRWRRRRADRAAH